MCYQEEISLKISSVGVGAGAWGRAAPYLPEQQSEEGMRAAYQKIEVSRDSCYRGWFSVRSSDLRWLPLRAGSFVVGKTHTHEGM